MSIPPDVGLIVTTYQRPHNLAKVLTSIAGQDFGGALELVVSDDGSTDDTFCCVRQFATTVSFPVRWTTHPHEGFHVARCRNDGFRISRAPYLLFLDGDCVVPRDFLTQHVRLRKSRTVVAGYCCRLNRTASDLLDDRAIRSGDFTIQSSTLGRWVPSSEFRSLAKIDRKAIFYRITGNPTKPRLRGGNFGIWRDDFCQVNGFDEDFLGWGCEDDDFGLRLRREGVSIRSACRALPTFHLWHPIDPSVPDQWHRGDNVEYFHQPDRPIYCLNGLTKRTRKCAIA